MKRQLRIMPFIVILVWLVLGPLTALASIDDTFKESGAKTLSSGYLSGGIATAPNDDSTTQAVQPYREQKTFPVLDFESFWANESNHLRVDGLLRGEKDFISELHYDHTGYVRLSLLDESLFHRLDHQVLPSSTPDAQILTQDRDPDDTYGVTFRQQDVALRLSPKMLASHLTVRFHRTTQDGERQLRYLDENCTSQCHIVGRDRPVKQTTREFFGMLDAHLGAIELSLDHLGRIYDNQAVIPTDTFGGGWQQHDVLPDNHYALTTMRAHNSLAGGIVAAGSLSVGERTNKSQQGDVEPIRAETDIFKAAGDLSWTPLPILHVAFRYRMTQLDNEVSSAYTTPDLDLPQAIDVNRNVYGVTIAVVPSNKLTIKGDYQHDQIKRDHLAENSFWTVPKEEEIDRVGINLRYRPFGRSTTRFDLDYLVTRSSDPAYAMANELTHVAKASARIAPAQYWGMAMAVRGEEGKNGGVTAPMSEGQVLFDRSSRKGDATANVWVTPLERLTIGGSFGYSDLLVEQDFRFGRYAGTTDVVARDVETRQIVRTSAVNLNLVLSKKVKCDASIHHVRGSYHYAPEFADLVVVDLLTDEGLSDIGSVELEQNGLTAGIDWQARESLNFGLRYLYDNYHDRKNERLDETVQSYMFTVAKSW